MSHYDKLILRIASGLQKEMTPQDLQLLRTIDLETGFDDYSHLLTIIYYELQKVGFFDGVEETRIAVLRKKMFSLMGHHIRQRQWFQKFIETLLPDEIPIMLLKGFCLADSIYEEDLPRFSGDIDFMVQKQHYDEVVQIMSGQGKRLVMNPDRMATHHRLFETTFEVFDPYNIYVEPHRGLFQEKLFNIDYRDVWKRSRVHPKYEQENVRMPSPEDSLLFNVIHSYRDLSFTPHSLMDFHMILSRWHPQMEFVFSESQRWGCSHLLEFSAAIISEIFPEDRILLDQCQIKLRRFGWGKFLFQWHHGFDLPATHFVIRKFLALFLADCKLNIAKHFINHLGLRIHDLYLSIRN